MKQQQFPLHWPEGWPRTKYPENSRFKVSLPAAINNVEKSLNMFASDSGKKLENVLVSSNASLMDNRPADAGIAVYFTWDGISTCIAVDRYQKIEENLQAIHHCIEAERTKLRHGGLNLVRAAFRGYAALPPPKSKIDPYLVLGLSPGCSVSSIDEAYRNLAKRCHPDMPGGSEKTMQDLNEARRQLMEGKP